MALLSTADVQLLLDAARAILATHAPAKVGPAPELITPSVPFTPADKLKALLLKAGWANSFTYKDGEEEWTPNGFGESPNLFHLDRLITFALENVEPKPIDMVLLCPSCGMQHIDAPDDREPPMLYAIGGCESRSKPAWTNPPHKTHLCHGCGHKWRPADVLTNGVEAVKTKGKDDSCPVLNLDLADWQLICQAASRSNWMPPEYFRNDWVHDVCNWLEHGIEDPAPPTHVTDEMVNRFLGWRLPDTFGPDCGISFKKQNHPDSWPIGTNLFTATETRAMLEHVLKATEHLATSDPEAHQQAITDHAALSVGTIETLIDDAEELRFYRRHGFPYVDWGVAVDGRVGQYAIKLPVSWPHPEGEGTVAAVILHDFTVEKLYIKARAHIESLGPDPAALAATPEAAP